MSTKTSAHQGVLAVADQVAVAVAVNVHDHDDHDEVNGDEGILELDLSHDVIVDVLVSVFGALKVSVG